MKFFILMLQTCKCLTSAYFNSDIISMSKVNHAFFALSLAISCLFCTASRTMSQNVEVNFTIREGSSLVRVSGRHSGFGTAEQRKILSFLKSAIGMSELGNRISDLTLADQIGKTVPY